MAEDFQDLIRQVKEANDIVEVVGSYVALKPAGQTFKGLCPFHDDQRPSFDVDPRRQRYRCWACGKFGDVFSFIQEQDRVSFLEALEVLAQRAGISLEKRNKFQPDSSRAIMLEVVRWSERQFHNCLLESPLAEAARTYLGERRLLGETVRKFGLGYAPVLGNWLTARAEAEGISLETLEQVGLIAKRQQGKGYYDRFRDRVMFPIRDGQGRTLGFGGRILPSSPFSSRGPKYYNSSETPLFSKSDLLYGLDQARQAASAEGYLAIVEGYTDVLLAHQLGVTNVVATMGTALNARHVQHLRRLVSRVVLVFDADAGGTTGVDRALEIFVRHDVSLRIATLPEGLDPYDLLIQQGADAFKLILTNAQDVLEFKLNQVCTANEQDGLEGRRRAVDEMLRIIARGPELVRQAEQVKRELMMTQIAQRFGIKEETLWARLKELRSEQQTEPVSRKANEGENAEPARRVAPAKAHERQLLEILLADPKLVAEAVREIPPEEVEHPGLRHLLEGLYRLHAEGTQPTLDQLRTRIDNPPLIAKAFELQERGFGSSDRSVWWHDIRACFRGRQEERQKHELQRQLKSATDPAVVAELLRQLQNRTSD